MIINNMSKAFKLKSGNKPPFKQMGGSTPMKQSKKSLMKPVLATRGLNVGAQAEPGKDGTADSRNSWLKTIDGNITPGVVPGRNYPKTPYKQIIGEGEAGGACPVGSKEGVVGETPIKQNVEPGGLHCPYFGPKKKQKLPRRKIDWKNIFKGKKKGGPGGGDDDEGSLAGQLAGFGVEDKIIRPYMDSGLEFSSYGPGSSSRTRTYAPGPTLGQREREITPLNKKSPVKQSTGESLHVRGGSSTLSSKELYKKRLKEGNVKVQRVAVNPFYILKKPINIYTRKKHKK